MSPEIYKFEAFLILSKTYLKLPSRSDKIQFRIYITSSNYAYNYHSHTNRFQFHWRFRNLSFKHMVHLHMELDQDESFNTLIISLPGNSFESQTYKLLCDYTLLPAKCGATYLICHLVVHVPCCWSQVILL